MKQRKVCSLLFALVFGLAASSVQAARTVQLTTGNGVLEGVVSGDGKVLAFKGVPYAAPPVGPLRWEPPQPVRAWGGVRKADAYGPRAMQGHIYDDMVFHDAGPSEDCLYLNIWRQANPPASKLPVMFWIHGGGFIAGASSEKRQDGANLCQKEVLVVSLNYRMGVFGFLALPELTAESDHHASGNYGLLDQVAALEWVKKNIAAFGGDPDNVTIFGESAGSISVSGLVASPLARGLFRRAIGESGAFFNPTRPLKTRADAEAAGTKFAQTAFGTTSLDTLRAKPAKEMLAAALKLPNNSFPADIDGYFLPDDCAAIFAAGQQNHVALLAGWNRDEGNFKNYFTNDAPTLENYISRARQQFGANADAFLKVYAATTDSQAKRAAQDLSGDRSIAHATWRWIEMHLQTGGSPVYRYEFDQTLPLPSLPLRPKAPRTTAPTTPHASDIEYIFGELSSKKLPWREEDRAVSEIMASYWSNFAKTGDPNGPGLPWWPAYQSSDGYRVLHISANSWVTPDGHRSRYEFLDHLAGVAP